jgi:tetratricopeptide (TPR) repeat protein
VESRIADIEEWLEMSDSGELQFLLGYVYYQLGRIGEAKKAIDAAYEKLPDAPAVKTLKKAIDSAGAGNQTLK